MRVFKTSRGLDPVTLIPGEDLVLAIDETHGLDLPHGVLADDHLGLDARRAIDDACFGLPTRWQKACGEHFVADGMWLPWLWESDLVAEAMLPGLSGALSVRGALRRHRPSAVRVVHDDALTRHVVALAAGGTGLPVTCSDLSRPPPGPAPRPGPVARRLRRAVLRATTRFGAPSLVRADSVLVVAYWPLMPLLDRMLADRRWRPAVSLGSLPTGPRRSLRSAVRAGWVGLPGPRDRARGRRAASAMIERAAAATPPALEVLGLDMGPLLFDATLALARERAGADLARLAMLRRVFEGGHVRQVVVPYDISRDGRLVVSAAQEAGVPTLLLQHGAYFVRQALHDMEVSDDVAVWSDPRRFPRQPRFRRPPEIVGYPGPRPPRRVRPATRPPAATRILVLGYGFDRFTAKLDGRFPLRHYLTALRALTRCLPDATVVLRPHPSDDPAPTLQMLERFSRANVAIDLSVDVLEALSRCDLCVGVPSTATLQAALVGTPVIALNVSGFEWCWPLGATTRVPIARSEAELAGWLERWATGTQLPGREDLLAALGAGDPAAAIERLLALLDGGGRRPRHTAKAA
jgi:hypothetical protein